MKAERRNRLGNLPNNFLERWIDKPPSTLGVIGIGDGGFPLALSFSTKIPVIGFDPNPQRIRTLKQWLNTQTIDITPKLKIHLTSNPNHLKKCSTLIVTASVPIGTNKHPYSLPLLSTLKVVGEAINDGTVVVSECTLYPGATEELFIPLIEKYSGLRSYTDFFVGFSPQTNTNIHACNNVKVVAAHDVNTLRFIVDLYSLVFDDVCPIHSIMAAESSIVMKNCERSLFIAGLHELTALINSLVQKGRPN
jgi:UDP-N-acetyl-D-galactosamine dehydrogenase